MQGQQGARAPGLPLAQCIQGQVDSRKWARTQRKRRPRLGGSGQAPHLHSPQEYKAWSRTAPRHCYAPGLRTEARFPGLKPDAGHYESFFLRAARPSGGEGLWVRYTIDRAPGAAAVASFWITWFDADAAPIAAKVSYAEDRLAFPPGGYIAIADAGLTPGRAVGSIARDHGDLSWDLTFDDGAEAFDHLSHGWMYTRSFPRTKVRSPYPSTRFSGEVRLGGRTIELTGWPGMVGHNWGTEHAEQWVWIDAVGIDGANGFVDIAAGRVRVAGRLTPWIVNGVVEFDGKRHRLGGFSRTHTFHMKEGESGAVFTIPGAGIDVRGRVTARAGEIVTWPYDDPAGGIHTVRNSSIADLDLTVEQTGETKSFSVYGSATYELGRLSTPEGKRQTA